MAAEVRRGYLDCPGGQVHFRRAGHKGPFLLLLHPTPMSSRSFEKSLPLLGTGLRAIAIDTPGYGMSDRPPVAEPRIQDYVDQTLAAVDALGIDEFALYGSHTGAAIAIALHNIVPQRVTHLIMSGVPILTESEIAFFFRNLGEPELQPGGEHLTRMWKSLGNLAPDSAVLDQLQMASSQAIAVYDHYLDGLRAVSKFDMQEAASLINRPVFVLSAEFDRLADQVDRLEELNTQTQTKIVRGMHPQLPWTNPALFAEEITTYVTKHAPSQRAA